MTQPMPNVYLDADAVMAAIIGASVCPDCRPGSRALVIEPQRGEWGIVVRHATTCPQLSPADQAKAEQFWQDFHRTTRSGQRPGDLPPEGTEAP